jgi:hypothetical protein
MNNVLDEETQMSQHQGTITPFCVTVSVLLALVLLSIGFRVVASNQKAAKVSEELLGSWHLEKPAPLSLEFMKSGVFRISQGKKRLFEGHYAVFDDGEIGFNKVVDGDGKRLMLPYFTGARAEIVIKATVSEDTLVLERPRYLEATIVIGVIKIPPIRDVQLKFKRLEKK